MTITGRRPGPPRAPEIRKQRENGWAGWLSIVILVCVVLIGAVAIPTSEPGLTDLYELTMYRNGEVVRVEAIAGGPHQSSLEVKMVAGRVQVSWKDADGREHKTIIDEVTHFTVDPIQKQAGSR